MQDRQWPALHFVYFWIHYDPIDVPYNYIPPEAKEQPLNLGKAFLKKCSCTIGVHNTDQQAVHPTEHVVNMSATLPQRSPLWRTPWQGMSARPRSHISPPPPSAGLLGCTVGWRLRWSTLTSPSCRSTLTGPRPKSRTAVTWSCTSWRGSFGPRSPRNDFNDFFRAFLHCGRQV